MKIKDAANIMIVIKTSGEEVFSANILTSPIEGDIKTQPHVFTMKKVRENNDLYEETLRYVGDRMRVEIDGIGRLYELSLENDVFVFTHVLQ
ncbi:hypothetical protein [Cytobacillus praedii]|uniref:hypothetical protein n=1 Tax=Cytobacillus praedii TaxID=1742358 RepID=UPI002E1D4C94|nr:hypothetical protein [Cytobacillus praedii]